jgi:hypothetical protein
MVQELVALTRCKPHVRDGVKCSVCGRDILSTEKCYFTGHRRENCKVNSKSGKVDRRNVKRHYCVDCIKSIYVDGGDEN